MKKTFYVFVIVLVCFVSLLISRDSSATFANSQRTHNYAVLVKANRGDVEGVKQLLNNGADPNTPPNRNDNGMTALMFAAWKGHSEIVRLLVRAGANVNAVSNTGATALVYAANAGSEESVKILLDNGARTDIKMPDGTTALFYGIKSRNPKVTKLIAARSSAATINARQTGGDTALIRAIKLDNLNVIDAILNGNPALEEKDNYGQTALMTASRKGNTRAVVRLLRKGTNPNTRDNRGITALTKAHVGNHRAVKQVLRRAGGRR